LFSGLWAAFDALAPHVQLVPVQSEASPAFTRSVAEHRWHATWPPAPTLAEGLEGGAGQTSVALAVASGLRGRTVRESSIRKAMISMWDATGVPIEGSAAVIEAARVDGLLDDLEGDVVGILTGGNVAAETLERLRSQTEFDT
jgi:threonine dehydratase